MELERNKCGVKQFSSASRRPSRLRAFTSQFQLQNQRVHALRRLRRRRSPSSSARVDMVASNIRSNIDSDGIFFIQSNRLDLISL